MEVRRLADSELSAYDSLAAENGNIFYSAAWNAIFGKQLQRYGVMNRNGELTAGFVLFEERRTGVRILRNPPCTPIIGPFTRLNATHPVAVLEERRKVLEAMADYFARISRVVISVSLDHEIIDGLPFHWKGFKTIPRYTYVIDLSSPLPEIFSRFSQGRRNDISKARRDGVFVEEVSDYNIVAKLVRSTFVRQQARLDSEVLDSILFRYATPQNSFARVAKSSGRAIACAFVVHDNTTAYYLLSGYEAEHKHHGAGALALAECIRVAQERGLKRFDFEGSSIHPIERFLRGFGGRLTHYFSVNRAWLPYEIMLKMVKRNTF